MQCSRIQFSKFDGAQWNRKITVMQVPIQLLLQLNNVLAQLQHQDSRSCLPAAQLVGYGTGTPHLVQFQLVQSLIDWKKLHSIEFKKYSRSPCPVQSQIILNIFPDMINFSKVSSFGKTVKHSKTFFATVVQKNLVKILVSLFKILVNLVKFDEDQVVSCLKNQAKIKETTIDFVIYEKIRNIWGVPEVCKMKLLSI